MRVALLALAGGLCVFLVLLHLLERNREVRKFWIARIFIALILGLLIWKLAPLWTRWDTVLDNPLLLLTMNGGLAAIFGGLFAFLTVVTLSLWQFRKEKPETRRWPLMTPLLAGLIVVGAWTWLDPLVFPPPGSDPGPAVQALVPDLEGRSHALADWKGKVVVVNFWATWCLPCLGELPEFQLFSKTPSNRVVLVGVNLATTEKEGEAGVLRFTSKHKISWTQLTDPAGTLQKAFAVTVIPTTVVLDPQGRVVDRREGSVDLFWLKSLESRFGSR